MTGGTAPAPTAGAVAGRSVLAGLGAAVVTAAIYAGAMWVSRPSTPQMLAFGVVAGIGVAAAARSTRPVTAALAVGAAVGALAATAVGSGLTSFDVATAVALGLAIAVGGLMLAGRADWFADLRSLTQYLLRCVAVSLVAGFALQAAATVTGDPARATYGVWLAIAAAVLFGSTALTPALLAPRIRLSSARVVWWTVGCSLYTVAMTTYASFVADPARPGLLGWPVFTAVGAYVAAVAVGVTVATWQLAVFGMMLVAATAAGYGRYTLDFSSVTDQVGVAALFIVTTAVVVLIVAVQRDATVGLLRRTRRSLQLLHAVVDAASAPIFAKDWSGDSRVGGEYILVNAAWRTAHGLHSEAVAGVTDADIFPAEVARTNTEEDLRVLATNDTVSFFVPGVGINEQGRQYRVDKFPLRDESGRPWGVGGVTVDLTEVLAVQAEQVRSAALLQAVFQESPTPTVLVRPTPDGALAVRVANAAMLALVGQQCSDAEQDLAACVVPEDQPGVRAILTAIALGEIDTVRPREVRLRRPDGGVRWARLSTATVVDPDGEEIDVVVQFEDFTARREAEQALSDQALHDQVTRLPNRRALDDRLKIAVARLRSRGDAVTVLFCDLDRFKDVNDNLGHQAGDSLLIEVAERLRTAVRPDDFVARLGGDEFVVVGGDSLDPHGAVSLGRRLQERLRADWRYGASTFRPTMSVGVVVADDRAVTPDELLRRADLAMYHAKDAGRDRVEVYVGELDASAQRSFAIQEELRRAVDTHGFVLRYQPIVRLSDQAVVKAEALVRLRASSGEILPPDEFIPQAEASGLIVPLGSWVARQALSDLVCLQSRLPDLRVAINVSPTQFHGAGFSHDLIDAARSAGVQTQHICVEVTETALLTDRDWLIEELHALRAEGVAVALDDFGTGYSSLSWLAQLPVDAIKIDRSFVDTLATDMRKAAIVRAVVSVTNDLGLTTIAEGIETEEQRDLLAGWGCDLGQGFLFGRPVPLDEEPWALPAA